MLSYFYFMQILLSILFFKRLGFQSLEELCFPFCVADPSRGQYVVSLLAKSNIYYTGLIVTSL